MDGKSILILIDPFFFVNDATEIIGGVVNRYTRDHPGQGKYFGPEGTILNQSN